MNVAYETFALIATIFGLFFMVVGAVGVVRLPDVYHRLHAASKCSTLGVLGLLLAAVFHIGTIAIAAKAVMVILFAFVATPLGVHMLGKAALRTRTPTWAPTQQDRDEITPPHVEADSKKASSETEPEMTEA
jgi:monovalent cation/proton antiporter MnhG/PhaG subunit